MAFRALWQHTAAAPAAVVAVSAASLFIRPSRAFAESPRADVADVSRKPIYDDLPASLSPAAIAAAPTTPLHNEVAAPPSTKSPSPTDRLATQVRLARLFLHEQVAKVEDATNETLTKALRLEHSFTSTIASLAPPKETNEKVLPNGLYVLVAAMAGSIVCRNRNILIRAVVPPLVGVGAAYAVLPYTMHNVGNLVWSYEERVPAIRDAHLQVRERVSRFVETGKAHSQMGLGMAEEKIGEVRKAIEEWVSKGT